MQHSYSDNTKQFGPSDENSSTRIEQLLRGAKNAAALRHALAMIDIEGAHRLAWHCSHFNRDQPRVPAGHPDEAIARVRERDPNWRPRPSLYESTEGRIRALEAEAEEAQARASELARVGIGPGPFACESIPARGAGRDFTAAERAEINRIGYSTGCHTCGTRDPGTSKGNFVLDHQLPNSRNPEGRPQRLYPHCSGCSVFQGLWIIRDNRRIVRGK